MNRKNLEQAKRLVKASYINQGEQALNARRKLVRPKSPAPDEVAPDGKNVRTMLTRSNVLL